MTQLQDFLFFFLAKLFARDSWQNSCRCVSSSLLVFCCRAQQHACCRGLTGARRRRRPAVSQRIGERSLPRGSAWQGGAISHAWQGFPGCRGARMGLCP